MAVYKQKGSKNWWFEFTWSGERIRESTKQSNKRIAEQMEAARKTQLAKGEVGLRDRPPVPTLKDFAVQNFAPFIESRFQSKPKTLEYYRNGLKKLNGFPPLAAGTLDALTSDKVANYVAKRREAGLKVSSINRELEVLRRMLRLAVEWGEVDKPLPKVEMLPGENHRERVLTGDQETRYLSAATAIAKDITDAYERALKGIRAKLRAEQPIKPEDPFLLRDVATILIDCGLRPEECFRLRWEFVRDGALHIPFGKTENSRRIVQLSQRAAAQVEMRRASAATEWVFPAKTQSGHIEKSTLKKQHAKASKFAEIAPFPLYTFRHTCLTRWAGYMDPFTLAYLAGHSDFSTTKRYVHPEAHTVRDAMERARNALTPHSSPHREENAAGSEKPAAAALQ